jgi:Peptidase A4 family
VPTVTNGSSVGQADATWVGIGGIQTHDLVQAGTQALISANGSVTYSAWIETLPGFSQTVSLAVSSGDSITTTLTQESAGTWRITITNNTRGTSYSRTVTYNSSLSSAEWVEEMVSNANATFIPLDSFGTVAFTNASATVNGTNENLSQLGAQPLQMVNGAGSTLATASALGSDSTSFSVTRSSASASSVVPRTVTGGRWHVISTATSTQGQPAASQPSVQQIPLTIVVRHLRGGGQAYTSYSAAYSSIVNSLPAGFRLSIIRL